MLRQARQKAQALRLANIAFEEVDADEQTLCEHHFDVILCSSAIVYFVDIPAVLRRWQAALKPGGTAVFSCFAETSPRAGLLFREVGQRYGTVIPNPNAPLGTLSRCRFLLKQAGFGEVEIVTEQFGGYLQNAESVWAGNANSAFGLQDVSWTVEKREQCKQDYLTEIARSSTKEGYWNDMTAFFVTARKS